MTQPGSLVDEPSSELVYEIPDGHGSATETVIRARAPLRISFCGGGTDVMPYPQDHGGCVLSATIDMYAFASVRLRPDREYRVFAPDGRAAAYSGPEEMAFDGHFDLVKACLRSMAPAGGLDLHLISDARPGSGLGSSSAMAVSMLAAVGEVNDEPLTPMELARRAYEVERHELQQAGGMQDQYAAALGGLNFIEFAGEDRVTVSPVRLRPEVRNELQASLLLFYTGSTHKSGGILRRQIAAYEEHRPSTLRSLERIKALTVDLKDALMAGDLLRFAQDMDAAWQEKRQLVEGISNQWIDSLYEYSRREGALGAKLLGAGGGGYLLLFCPFAQRAKITEAMERAGARVCRFDFEERGVQTWRVR